MTIKDIKSKETVKYILISCCTYKRPQQLNRLLKSLISMNYPEGIKTELLIVDNDINQSAKEIVQNFKSHITIHYIIEPNIGLSNVRNRVLKEGIRLGATHIAFIDDDEIADVNWLINHVDFYNNFENIYISSGPTYKKFEQVYPNYIMKNATFKTISSKKLGGIKDTCASGNVFFPLNIIKEHNIFFSEKYNYSGSEDTDFFSRLKNLGYNIGWNYNAINYEIVEDKRANIKWILKRAYNTGYSVSIIKFENSQNLIKKLMYITTKFFTVIFNIIISILSIFCGLTFFFNNLTLTAKNIGKLLGSINGYQIKLYNNEGVNHAK